MKNVKAPLYPNCTKFTKMSAIVALYKLKALSGWFDKSFSDLLKYYCMICYLQTMLSHDPFMMLENFSKHFMWDIKRFMHV